MSAAQRGWRHVTQQPKERRRLFRCGRKRGYQNAANAERDMQRLMSRKGETGLEVYHCRLCKGWHVGHAPQEQA